MKKINNKGMLAAVFLVINTLLIGFIDVIFIWEYSFSEVASDMFSITGAIFGMLFPVILTMEIMFCMFFSIFIYREILRKNYLLVYINGIISFIIYHLIMIYGTILLSSYTYLVTIPTVINIILLWYVIKNIVSQYKIKMTL